jgi:hypothetical protein
MPFLPVGGQAVIEGVMMRSPSMMAVAVRHPDGSVGYLEKPFISITRRIKLLGLPVIRGAVRCSRRCTRHLGAQLQRRRGGEGREEHRQIGLAAMILQGWSSPRSRSAC